MIGVGGEDSVVVALGALGDHQVRTVRTNDAGDLAAQGHRGLHTSVGPVQEREIGDAHFFGRGSLFVLADRDALFTTFCRIVAAGVPGGDEAVRHVDAPIGQKGDGSGRTKVHVIGMSHYHKGAFDGLIPFVHGQSLFAHNTESCTVGSRDAKIYKYG